MAECASNRKVFYDYEILEEYEAGIALHGYEVKSVRAGRMNLAGSFVVLRSDEAWLTNADIAPYQAKNTPAGYDSTRSRRLLLHKREISELFGKTAHQGLTLVPLRVYTKGPKIKLTFGLARRKKKYDKREVIRRRDTEREIGRSLKR